jgi:Holliday junction resolvasome RuvABC DNA-binding subunit
LDGSRVALKNIRDAENTLLPRRNIRAGIVLQINRIKSEGQKGADRKLAELQDQLKRAEDEDQDLERQYEITKRKFLRENEENKWAAIREVGLILGNTLSLI